MIDLFILTSVCLMVIGAARAHRPAAPQPLPGSRPCCALMHPPDPPAHPLLAPLLRSGGEGGCVRGACEPVHRRRCPRRPRGGWDRRGVGHGAVRLRTRETSFTSSETRCMIRPSNLLLLRARAGGPPSVVPCRFGEEDQLYLSEGPSLCPLPTSSVFRPSGQSLGLVGGWREGTSAIHQIVS
jgi:hypothetical protein